MNDDWITDEVVAHEHAMRDAHAILDGLSAAKTVDLMSYVTRIQNAAYAEYGVEVPVESVMAMPGLKAAMAGGFLDVSSTVAALGERDYRIAGARLKPEGEGPQDHEAATRGLNPQQRLNYARKYGLS